MSGGKHADDDTDGVINRLDPDAAAYEGGFVDALGGEHREPEREESDFTGEWADEHVARLAAALPRGAARASGVTAGTLRAAMGRDLPLAKYPTLVADYNAALLAAGCTTINRAAMFAAQVGHESVGLNYFEEIASGQAYEGRKDLGNVVVGDGRRFKGRGPIQLTGRTNYLAFGSWCRARRLVDRDDFFVLNPTAVATSRWGFLASSWYWVVARADINQLCDRGDLDTVTRRINGGLNGVDDRRRRWQACLRLGAALLPGPAGPAAPSGPDPAIARRHRQQALILGDPVERAFGPGDSTHRIVCPTGSKASSIVSQAWLSASVAGRAQVEVWAQTAAVGQAFPAGSAPKDQAERDWTLYGGDRPWFELPNGTEMVTVRVTAASGPGSILIEQRAA